MRSKYSILLPEHLESGGVILSPKGTVAIVVRTTKKNKFGERLYRLRYLYKFQSGNIYTLLTDQPYYENEGDVLKFVGYGWTRDQLAQMDCRYVPKKDVVKSRVLVRARKKIFTEN